MPDGSKECLQDWGAMKQRVIDLEKTVEDQQAFIDKVEAERNRLLGIGSAVSLAMVAIGFVFGEAFKQWVNRAIQ